MGRVDEDKGRGNKVCPKIALDFGSESRRGKGRIVVLCNPCRNTEAGPKDKQDWMIICFRGPNIRRCAVCAHKGLCSVQDMIQHGGHSRKCVGSGIMLGPDYFNNMRVI